MATYPRTFRMYVDPHDHRAMKALARRLKLTSVAAAYRLAAREMVVRNTQDFKRDATRERRGERR